MVDYSEIITAQIAGDMAQVVKLVEQALSEGQKAEEILSQGLIAAMDIVGERMENGDMYIPEVLMSARSMSSAVEILKPHLDPSGSTAAKKIVIGTVKGDLHDIGKNLVKLMMEGAGFEVNDLGTDVSPEAFAKEVKEFQPEFLALSALLTTTMPMMKLTIDALVEGGVREGVKVLVGGAPVTTSFSEKIGADGFAPDAGSAIKLVKSFS